MVAARNWSGRSLECRQSVGDGPPKRILKSILKSTVKNETFPLTTAQMQKENPAPAQPTRGKLTGEDGSPYAKALAAGKPRWHRMCEWIWFAAAGRMKHLAMMRRSRASLRFATISLFILSVGLAMVQSAVAPGWRRVTDVASLEPTGSTQPTGNGWVLVASVPRPLSPGHEPGMVADLWWNTTQAMLMGIAGFLTGWLLLAVALLLVRVGVTRAHQPSYRSEQRMTAALHYSTAWVVPLFVAVVLWVAQAATWVGEVRGWRWYPPERGLILSAAVVGAFGLVLWWFWLVRMGATAPERTRGRVLAFLAMGAPLIALTAAAGWWFGLNEFRAILCDALRLNF